MKVMEAFKPKLRKGRIVIQGSRLLYECADPLDQIVLPIETSDFLVLCDGQSTVRDIVRRLYRKNGTVHFKTIFRTILLLQQRGFFENGDDFPSRSIGPLVPEAPGIFGQPFFEFFIGRRILNDRVYPGLFYLITMTLLILSLIGIEPLTAGALDVRFLRWNGSYLNGLILFFGFNSLLLSLKNFVKAFMLLALTGRIYDGRIVFNGFGIYFKVGTDSLYLIDNKLFLTLFHLSVSLCYFAFLVVLRWLAPGQDALIAQALLVAMLLMILDFDPFRPSELTQFFKALYEDESLNRLTDYLKNRSLMSILRPEERDRDHSLFLVFAHIALVWAAASFYLIFRLLEGNYLMLEYSLLSEAWPEKVAGLLVFASLIFLGVRIINDLLETLYFNFLTPWARRLRRWWSRPRSTPTRPLSPEDMVNRLAYLPLFSYFNKELLVRLVTNSFTETFAAGAPIIIQGDVGTDVYVLLDGVVQVEKRDTTGTLQRIAEMRPVSIFGEVAVIEETRRTAGVVALTKVLCLRIPADVLRSAARDSGQIKELNSFRNAIMINQYFNSAPLFRDLPSEVVQLFTGVGTLQHFKSGDTVFLEGTLGDAFYLVIRGAVEVVIEGRVVNRIRQGSFFGEISVIADVPRTATVKACEPLTVLKIQADDFWEIITENMEMAMFIETVGEMRLREDIRVLEALDFQRAE